MTTLTPLPETADVISLVLAEARGDFSVRPRPSEIAEARAISNQVRKVSDAAAALDHLLELVRRYPGEEVLQRLVGAVLDRVQDRRGYLVWLGIDRRFPQSRDAFIRALRWVLRLDGVEAGEAYFRARFPEEPSGSAAKLVYARGLIELRDTARLDEVFEAIMVDVGASEATLVDLGRLFAGQGDYSQAETVAEVAFTRFGSTKKVKDLLEQIARGRQAVSSSEGLSDEGHLTRLVVDAFRSAADIGRRGDAEKPTGFLGHTVLINGGLGAGGAERQFTNTALALHAATRDGRLVDGVDIVGPITVISRSLHSREGADFFAPVLRKAGLVVHSYDDFEEYGGQPKYSVVRQMAPLLPHLPAQMRNGVLRLTDTLRYLGPDVVHIWQDGSILATGLAAVAAGVPRIILGVRTMPPQDRLNRNKPEYLPTFRALLAEPGVTLVSNSRIVASRYADWLELKASSIQIIPNGVDRLDEAADGATLALAAPLKGRTPDSFVVGSVMRFDENKRPLLWIDVAAAVLARNPSSRFILVGGGPLLESATQHARALGLADRITFAGPSSDVGFWLSQMDVFLLLSRHEGLPNVLIEAQMAGVPVVSTPAGGSGETMKLGETGTLLPSCENLVAEEIADALHAWRREGPDRQALGRATREWAEHRFSLDGMIEATVHAYLHDRVA